MVFLDMGPLWAQANENPPEAGEANEFVYRFRACPPSEAQMTILRLSTIGFRTLARARQSEDPAARAYECADRAAQNLGFVR
jgi:hypothetical protein